MDVDTLVKAIKELTLALATAQTEFNKEIKEIRDDLENTDGWVKPLIEHIEQLRTQDNLHSEQLEANLETLELLKTVSDVLCSNDQTTRQIAEAANSQDMKVRNHERRLDRIEATFGMRGG